MPSNSLARHSTKRGRVLCACGARLGIAALLFLMLPAAAGAYTLVLRRGRHVNVPDDFKVTPAAVVYESSPGFSVTVWPPNLDFVAAERANDEPAGSFAKSIKPESREGDAAARGPKAVKAGRGTVRRVTNKEIEPSRLRREVQEEEYERTRRERGMPSRQELRRRVEEEDRWLREWARRMREERRAAELESLRYELANVRRDLNQLSLQLSRQAAGRAPAYAPPRLLPVLLRAAPPIDHHPPLRPPTQLRARGLPPPSTPRPVAPSPAAGAAFPHDRRPLTEWWIPAAGAGPGEARAPTLAPALSARRGGQGEVSRGRVTHGSPSSFSPPRQLTGQRFSRDGRIVSDASC